jgi:MerR family transcriptional regulator, light-induced transcriptional regulator
MTREEADGQLAVSSVSRLLGIPVPTIRSWERRYGFPRPARTEGSHRRYDHRDVEQLRALRDEITAGIRPAEAVVTIRRRFASGHQQAELVRRIVDAGLDYEGSAIRSILNRAEAETGLDQTIQAVVLPVLREIGTLWQVGTCDVAHEHFVSQQVRAWLARRLTVPGPRAKAAVLACGPNDLHSIGLEAFSVLLTRRRGVRCLLLGAQTPVASLVTACRWSGATAVVVTSHLNLNRRAAVAAIRAVAALPLGLRVFYAGNAFAASKARRGVPGRYLGRDLIVAADLVHATLDSPAPAASNRKRKGGKR